MSLCRKTPLILGAVLSTFFLLRYGLVINTSESLPPGIYYRTTQEPKRGDIVLVSPPDAPIFREALAKHILTSGASEAGTCPLIKIMAGVDGDYIEITPTCIRINGKELESSKRMAWQIQGQIELPMMKRLDGEVLLYTPHPRSFDSRYFGPLKREYVLSTIQPLVLWN